MSSLWAYVFQYIINPVVRDTDIQSSALAPSDQGYGMQDCPEPNSLLLAPVSRQPLMLLPSFLSYFPDGDYTRGHNGPWTTHHSLRVVQWKILHLAWTVFRCLHCQLHIFCWLMYTLSEEASGIQSTVQMNFILYIAVWKGEGYQFIVAGYTFHLIVSRSEEITYPISWDIRQWQLFPKIDEKNDDRKRILTLI